jgi:hypothetical protein
MGRDDVSVENPMLTAGAEPVNPRARDNRRGLD